LAYLENLNFMELEFRTLKQACFKNICVKLSQQPTYKRTA
jgi:hypothetical protein